MSDRAWRGGRRTIRRLLRWMLPRDEWCEEFLDTLEEEVARRAESRAGIGLTLWYLGQALSPDTIAFAWATWRRRRSAVARGAGGGEPTAGDIRRPAEMAGMVTGLWIDLRQSVRSVLRDRLATGMIVLTLSLGIGSVTAMYTVSERLFLRGPLHVTAPGEIATIHLSFDDPGGSRKSPWVPYLTARAIREQASGISGSSLYRVASELADVPGRIRPVDVAEVDGRYFGLLGVVPEAGRFIGGETSEGVVVLSHGIAVREFGSPSLAIGRPVGLGEARYTVVGVAPEGFAGPGLDRIDAWIPLDEAVAASRNWRVAVRVPTDREREAAAAELQAIHERQDPGRFFQWAREGTIGLTGDGADLAGERTVEMSIARLLLGVVGLVLVIAWANTLNLLLARMVARRSEITVRLALGIGRHRLFRMLLTESLLLSLLGGAVSLLVAHSEALLVRRVLLPNVAWGGPVLDTRLLLVTMALVVVSAAILAWLPVRHAHRADLRTGLAGARQGASPGRARLLAALATSQIALSAILLLCAGLFVKSFWTIRVTDLGVDPERVRVVELRSLDHDLGGGGDAEDERYRRALERLRNEGGPSRFALAVGLPFVTNFGKSIHVEGLDSIPLLPGGGPFVSAVSGGYFTTVGTEIVRGVGIRDEDVRTQAKVTVVGESTARALWPGEDALGRCVRVGAPFDPCKRVIGVAEDVHRVGYREPASLQLYVPLGGESGFSGPSLLVRTEPGSDLTDSRLSADLTRAEPDVDYVEIRRLDSFLDAQIRPWRLGAVMLSMASGLALLISLMGVLAVLTYIVAQRRREFGIRMALGASDASIRRLVLRRAVLAGSVGVSFGFTGVLVGSPWVGPLLFETPVADPLVMTVVASGLISISLLACLIPASRASRTDPVTCLRTEA